MILEFPEFLDGTKVKANASKHKAFRYEHACKLEKQIMKEVAELMRRAEEADGTEIPDGLNIPKGLTLRAERLKGIATAKVDIELNILILLIIALRKRRKYPFLATKTMNLG